MFEDVERYLVDEMNKRGVPGFSAVIVKDKEIVWAKGFGYANREAKIHATPDTVYRVASVSKPVIATGLMQLVERGLIDLDAPVNSVMEGVKIRTEFHDAPTVRNILTHTSGLPVHVDPTFFSEKETMPLTELIRSSAIAVQPPNREIVYSNTAFNIVGYLVGQLSGRPYPEYMEENLFRPLGMNLSAFEQSKKIRENMAQPYAKKKDGPLEPIGPWYGGSHPEKPCGSLFSTAKDLGHFVIAHMNNGVYKRKRVLKKSSVEEMHRLQSAAGSSRSGYGLAWKRNMHYGRLMLSHTGGNLGWTAHVCFYPHTRLGIVILCNLNDNTGWRPPAREALYIASGGSLSFDPSTTMRKRIPKRWRQYEGEYAHGFQSAKVRVEGGNLILERGGAEATLEELSKTVYLVHGGGSDGLEFTFEVDETGAVKQLDVDTETYRPYGEDARPIDEKASLLGTWTGNYVHPHGYFKMSLVVEESGASVSDMSGSMVPLKSLRAGGGRLEGETTFKALPGYVGWGASEFQVKLTLAVKTGELEGRMDFKSATGDSAVPLTLKRE
ncbi:serine hydrolase [Candidatus Bathyarchaeota archaeon]|nr:serine hydrolase [Candidatus Bathyarchaeota archaeon]